MTKFLLTFFAIYFFYKYITKPVYIVPPKKKEKEKESTKKYDGDYIDYEEVK